MSAFAKIMISTGAALVLLCPSIPADAQFTAVPVLPAPSVTSQTNPDGRALRPIRPQCLHRETDDRPSMNADNKVLTVWLAVPQKTIVDFAGWGAASGSRAGDLKITLLLDGVAVGQSEETARSRGPDIIHARADTQVTLLPGRQHKLTARPEAPNKTLLGFTMQVSIKTGCT
jgi:hypothetical protein